MKFAIFVLGIQAFSQTLSDCHTVFIAPMPSGLNTYLTKELLKRKLIPVTVERTKAACIMAFGNELKEQTRTTITESGQQTTISTANQSRPRSLPNNGLAFEAAVAMSHSGSGVIVWATSKSEFGSWMGGPGGIAGRIAAQLGRDLRKANQKSR